MNSISAAVLSPEVLDLLASSYGKRDANEVVERIVVRNAPKAPRAASKLATVKAAAKAEQEAQEEAANAKDLTSRPPMIVIDLPKAGTLDAKSFLRAMAKASSRDESIKAIAGYCGYDRHGDFGSQDTMARMKAKNELRPVKALPLPVHSAAPSVKGYISGVNDPKAKRIADLQGREVYATDEMQAHTKAAEAATSEAERNHFATLAAVEAARINSIRAELATLIGE